MQWQEGDGYIQSYVTLSPQALTILGSHSDYCRETPWQRHAMTGRRCVSWLYPELCHSITTTIRGFVSVCVNCVSIINYIFTNRMSTYRLLANIVLIKSQNYQKFIFCIVAVWLLDGSGNSPNIQGCVSWLQLADDSDTERGRGSGLGSSGQYHLDLIFTLHWPPTIMWMKTA